MRREHCWQSGWVSACPGSSCAVIVDTTLGNPLFALELGRGLVDSDLPAIGDELPVPDAVEDLLGTRVDLASPPRSAVCCCAVALSARPESEPRCRAHRPGYPRRRRRRRRARRRGGPGARARIRCSRRPRGSTRGHASDASYIWHSPIWSTIGELRARHLALAASGPDEALAGQVAAAAVGAGARGAVHDAAVLGEHALRLTPSESMERPGRVLALAHSLAVAGEKRRVTDLLTRELEGLPPGPDRVQAYLLLPGVSYGATTRSAASSTGHSRRAKAGPRPGRPSWRTWRRTTPSSVSRGSRRPRPGRRRRWSPPEAAGRKWSGGPSTRLPGPEVSVGARSTISASASPRCRRTGPTSSSSPERIAGQQLVWRGRMREARALLTNLLSMADDRGEPVSYALARLHVCELELRAGCVGVRSRPAPRMGRALGASAPRVADVRAVSCPPGRGAGRSGRGRALGGRCDRACGGEGDRLGPARGAAGPRNRGAARPRSTAGGREPGPRLGAHAAGRSRGAGGLPGGTGPGRGPRRAGGAGGGALRLGAAAGPGRTAGTSVGAGDGDEVRRDRSESRIGLLDRPVCSNRPRTATASWDSGSTGHERCSRSGARSAGTGGGPLRGLRSSRPWTPSRNRARRAGPRRRGPSWGVSAHAEGAEPGDLTPAERRVAELAAQGHANKEIAGTLFVSVHTVEVHLSHVYAKLGIRSRSQLVRSLPQS